MKYAAVIVVCLPLLGLHVSCTAGDGRNVSGTGPQIFFAPPPNTPAKASALVDGEDLFTAGMLGKSTTLGGALFDTSAIDLFYVNVYDGFRIRRNRLYVANRIYEEPSSTLWCEVDARISKVDVEHQDHNQIEIGSFHPLDMAAITDALEASAAWVQANHSRMDLNRLKQRHDFAQSMDAAVANLDFNQTPYRPLKEIVGIDRRRGVAEFLCGRHTLEEVKYHHASYAQISAIYDLNAKRLLRVVVDPSGYWEE